MKLKVSLILLVIMMAARLIIASEDIVSYRVKVIEDHARVMNFEYESYEKRFSAAQEQAKNELLPPDQEAALFATVPKGGMLDVELLGATWDMANGINWTYVITDESGKELFRTKGGNYREPASVYETHGEAIRTRYGVQTFRREVQVAPQKTVWGVPVFTVRDKTDIPVPVPDVFKVYVIDGINKNRCSYLLTKRVH
ncbi:MAG: hypothetical protein WCI81_04095 [Chlorobiaceae bacterium]